MKEVMICLVGEQPLPNLLPVRYDKPEHVVLAYTEATKKVHTRLEKVLRSKAEVHSLEVLPFNIPAIRDTLEKFIVGQGWKPAQIVFNLTGGTKAMAFAAYSLAEAWRSRFLYLESAETAGQLYRYCWNDVGIVFFKDPESVPPVITLDDYLTAHLDSYCLRKDFSLGTGGEFEKVVYEALRPVVDEIDHGIQAGGALDIDLAFRCGNKVGIAEVKHGILSKKGIDQLNTAGRREFLGIYTKKFLIAGTVPPPDKPVSNLKELAEVSEIKVIELPGYEQANGLSNQDRERLVREVAETLGCW